jgi:hypothetical protein
LSINKFPYKAIIELLSLDFIVTCPLSLKGQLKILTACVIDSGNCGGNGGGNYRGKGGGNYSGKGGGTCCKKIL